MVVIGDGRKYLSCLLTPKVVVDPETNRPSSQLEESAKKWCDNAVGGDSNVETIDDFLSGPHARAFRLALEKGIDHVNDAGECFSRF